MRKLFLITLFIFGCAGPDHPLTDCRIDNIKKIGSMPNGHYFIFITEDSKEVRKVFFDSNVCNVTIKEDVEKGVPIYADGKYYLDRNRPVNKQRVYKDVVFHLHSASEIDGTVKE